MVILLAEEAYRFFRSSSNLLKDRSEKGRGVAVLRGVWTIEPAQLLQARQLQRVQVRGVVLSQMSVSLQLQEGKKRFVSNTTLFSFFFCKWKELFQSEGTTHQSGDIMQHLDFRQEEQIGLTKIRIKG